MQLTDLPPEVLKLVLDNLSGLDIVTLRSFGYANCWSVQTALQLIKPRPLIIIDDHTDYLGLKRIDPATRYEALVYINSSITKWNDYYTSLKCIEHNLQFMDHRFLKDISLHFKLGVNDYGDTMIKVLSNLMTMNIKKMKLKLVIVKLVGKKYDEMINPDVLSLLSHFNWHSIKIITNKAERESFNHDLDRRLSLPIYWIRNSFSLKELYLGEKVFLEGKLSTITLPNLTSLGFECSHLQDRISFNSFLNDHAKQLESLSLRKYDFSHDFLIQNFENLNHIEFSGYQTDTCVTIDDKRFLVSKLSKITVHGKYPSFTDLVISEGHIIEQNLELEVNHNGDTSILPIIAQQLNSVKITFIESGPYDTVKPALEPFQEEIQREVRQVTLYSRILKFVTCGFFLYWFSRKR
ncbi:hypothetical protein DFJ63DRAFT_313298 [Scheffersomyces coipomensis]|uniref:uncharacterized protein n=1 Tax=Scheffersomyces coipomensis TaxID=1788519 RepID=UPI00315DAFC0